MRRQFTLQLYDRVEPHPTALIEEFNLPTFPQLPTVVKDAMQLYFAKDARVPIYIEPSIQAEEDKAGGLLSIAELADSGGIISVVAGADIQVGEVLVAGDGNPVGTAQNAAKAGEEVRVRLNGGKP